MAHPFRLTMATRLVLDVLVAEAGAEHYGAAIGRRADLPTGTVHPILARLEGAGWVASRWEDVDPRAVKRPARRFYRLTDEGAVAAREALARPRTRGTAAPRATWDATPGVPR